MRKLIVFTFFWMLQHASFSQNKAVDSLNALLNKAKEDTAKLNVYIALVNTCEIKDILLYANSALNIVDKLLNKTNDEQERENLFYEQSSFLDAIVFYYTKNNITDWKKVFAYDNNRLETIKKTGNQKRTAELLLNIAHISLDGKKDSAMFFANIQKSIDIFTKIKDSAFIVIAYNYLFLFTKSAGNYTKAFESVQYSIALSRQLDYQKGIAKGLTQLADLYRDFGEYDQAKENYQAALNILYKTKDTAELFNVLAALGGFYYTQHNTAKALEYYDKLIEICTKQTIPGHQVASVYKWIGMTYNDNNEYENALRNFDKSRFLFDSAGDVIQKANVLNEIGTMYNKQKDFKKALSYHSATVKIADSLNWANQKPWWLYLVALDYYGLKNFSKAKEINDVALTTYKKYWYDAKKTSDIELLAFQIDSARGDGNSALAHYKVYSLLKENLKGDEIKNEAQGEKFRSEINKQKLEQEKKDAIAKRTRNLQYLVIAAFLLSGIFLLYAYLRKNKDKKQIERAYSELKSTQAQLIQSEKMASLGELTAGIAHEIQNPLNFVNNFSEVNREMLEELKAERLKPNADKKVEDDLINDLVDNSEKINHHGKRADAIVKGMLQHSRKSSGQKEPTDINALCDEYIRLCYHGLRAKDKNFNADFKTDFDENIGKINVVPQDIGRVLLNLFNNAFYATNEKQKAESLTQNAEYKPTVSVQTKKLNDKIEIKVSDNGNGIPLNIIDKIFQPFFTTKPTGQGTGLGLSLAYDIITKEHNGTIKAESEEGKGSMFIIQLPVI